MVGSSAGSKSLKDYLKKYESNSNEEDKKKKKKKKKPDTNHGTGVLVVDEDPIWQKPVNLEEEEGNDSPDEEKPQVEEDIEVRRMKRLEQLRLRRAYNAIAEDGSGWVSIDLKHQDSKKPDSDMSPPRKLRTRNDSPSPEPAPRPPGSGRENTDLSPPRQRQSRHVTPLPDSDPKPGHSTGLNSDLSPPRKQRARNDSPSPEPRLRPTREGSDLSPPRQHRRRYHTPSPDPNKIPEQSTDMDSDLSPPRKSRFRNDTPSPGPELKPVKEDTDLSPPRQKRKHHQARSPERDISISRQPQRGISNRHDDLSPPRKSKKDPGSGRLGLTDLSRSSHASEVPDLSPPRKIRKEEKGVHRTGLISGGDIREEISKKKKEDLLRFEEMDPSVTGRGAEAVYRDKLQGGRISREEYLKSKEKKKEKPEEKKLEWGKGLAQKREAEARLQELELEKDKPFARTRDDPELDRIMKDRLRWGDPMAHLVKKKHSEPVLLDLGENEKMKESGFIIPQDIPSHSWIKRGLDAAPNRYGIRPGRHWDGVDRSTGYEKQLFTKSNEKRATEREAYLWSVADM
ncbi:BUD13-like [Melia azedarach]|uniref:BUD13-like n=1 Tax=Melia azedarach TaxID=155640 RepID=A0ACC1YZ32_MELAZ|nr:BUD13-like [Melia azedarach]